MENSIEEGLQSATPSKMEFKVPELEDVLKYRNENVVYGFRLAFDVDEEEAEDIFVETLRWLWYCNHPDSRKSRSIDKPLLVIDEMWHTFILYTVDYFKFCKEYFGRYLHHAPTTKEGKEQYRSRTKKEKRQSKEDELSIKYDVLGKETFIKWYHTYPEKYTQEKLLTLRLK